MPNWFRWIVRTSEAGDIALTRARSACVERRVLQGAAMCQRCSEVLFNQLDDSAISKCCASFQDFARSFPRSFSLALTNYPRAASDAEEWQNG